MNRPPTPVNDWGVLFNSTWSWEWVPPVFPTSRLVRIADLDGWVEQGGYLLLIDGAVGNPQAYKPSNAVRIAVRTAANITALVLAAPDLDDQHVPTAITSYYLLPGPWPAASWQWNKWTPIRAFGEWEMTALIAEWAAWAVYSTGTR